MATISRNRSPTAVVAISPASSETPTLTTPMTVAHAPAGQRRTLREILQEPHTNAQTPPDAFCRVIRTLMDPADATNEGPERPAALKALNVALGREGFEAFYAEDKQCYLRHIGTKKVAGVSTSPHRPFSAVEVADVPSSPPTWTCVPRTS